MSKLLKTDVDDHIGYISFNRGSKRNALSHKLADEFDRVLDDFASRGIGIVVLRALGSVFCAGNDTTELNDPGPAASDRVIGRILDEDMFFVAVVEAPVYGAGVSIVAVCPVTLSTIDSTFALPERNLGLFASGVMAYLEPHVGSRHAVEFGLLGAAVTAERALHLGLVNEVVAPPEINAAISRWLKVLTDGPEVTRQAGRAWRSLFQTAEFLSRKAYLDSLLVLPEST